jgi:hypothetical protein
LQLQVRWEALDQRLLQDHGNILQLNAAIRAMLEVEIKDALARDDCPVPQLACS